MMIPCPQKYRAPLTTGWSRVYKTLLLGMPFILIGCDIGSHATGQTETLNDTFPDINTVPFYEQSLEEDRSQPRESEKMDDIKRLTNQGESLEERGRKLWEKTFKQKRLTQDMRST